MVRSLMVLRSLRALTVLKVLQSCSLAHSSGFPRSGERSYRKQASSEKEMGAMHKKAAPLEPLAKNAGDFDVFQGAHAELLEPLGPNCYEFGDREAVYARSR